MIDIDAERVRFEAWATDNGLHPRRILRNQYGEYECDVRRHELSGWLAAMRFRPITNEVSDEQVSG